MLKTTHHLEDCINQYTTLLEENKHLSHQIQQTNLNNPMASKSFLCSGALERNVLIFSAKTRVSLISSSFNSTHCTVQIDLSRHSLPITLITLTEVHKLDSFDFAVAASGSKRLCFSVILDRKCDEMFLPRLFERNVFVKEIVRGSTACCSIEGHEVVVKALPQILKISSTSLDLMNRLKKEIEER